MSCPIDELFPYNSSLLYLSPPEKAPAGRPPEKGHLEFPFLFWNAFKTVIIA
jgi:hypothetical protein